MSSINCFKLSAVAHQAKAVSTVDSSSLSSLLALILRYGFDVEIIEVANRTVIEVYVSDIGSDERRQPSHSEIITGRRTQGVVSGVLGQNITFCISRNLRSLNSYCVI